jgi:hypothetical protein
VPKSPPPPFFFLHGMHLQYKLKNIVYFIWKDCIHVEV